MSLVKINYHQYHIPKITESPFSLDGIGFEPEMAYTSSSKNTLYSECPAWKHKSTRTFLIRSPVDIELQVDVPSQRLIPINMSNQEFYIYTFGTVKDGWCTPETTTIQLSLPTMLFWTEQKNVWVESKPHWQTAVRNNITSVPGWFNLSNWTRPIAAAFNVVDTSKPIKINRGDVLYEVSFYPKNLDDGIKLEKCEPPKHLIDKTVRMGDVKNFLRHFSRKFLFKNSESKCPFHFMWK